MTGSWGMLGTDMVAAVAATGDDVVGVDKEDVDLSDPAAARAAVAGFDVVVNCAAWTAVDAAEEHEPAALVLNEGIARWLAQGCRDQGARLVQISTDYVFDGSASTPYREESAPEPRSAYGRTKAAGERAVREELPGAHQIVRTAWLYGAHGRCFPKTIAGVARERGSVGVVDDQVGQPTWTRDVADVVLRLADAPAGTYHATSSGQCSWFEFARAVVSSAGLDPSIVTATSSDDFVQLAPRPAYSVLGHGALEAVGLAAIGDWRGRWLLAADEVLA